MFTPSHYASIPTVDLLSWTFANVSNFPDKPIYVDAHNSKSRLTAREVLRTVNQLIAGLRARGVGPGDNVCILCYNTIYYTPLCLGIVGAGACYVGANPAYNESELRHIFSVSAVKAVIVQPELLAQTIPAAASCGIPKESLLVFNSPESLPPEGFQSWRTLLEHGEQGWLSFDDEKASRSTIAALVSTSGTTGLPKAAAISHYAHVAQSVLLYDSANKPYEVRRLISLPQFHAFAAPLVHIAPLREGHTTYIMKKYHRQLFLDTVSAHNITETALVPPLVRDLLAQGEVGKKALSSLRYAWCAGAPLSAKLQNEMAEFLHSDAILSQVWGMSEIGWITTFHFPEKDATGSVGRLLPNMEARIIDETGTEVKADGVQGEIMIRGPSVMHGYLANPQATADSLDGEWLRTGDIGHCDSGKWYIRDRAKEMIKVRGWQVSPSELEACLLGHPSVLDAAVVGVELGQDEGEVPRAYIVAKPGHSECLQSKDIEDYFQGRLAKFKYLAGGVAFVESIPRGASGKVLRKLLKDRAAAEVGRARVNGTAAKTT